jgi:hypothetical protein
VQAGIHGHVFINGGILVALSGSGRTWQSAWHEFTTTFRWSVVSAQPLVGRWASSLADCKQTYFTMSLAFFAGGWHCMAYPHRQAGAQHVPNLGQAAV